MASASRVSSAPREDAPGRRRPPAKCEEMARATGAVMVVADRAGLAVEEYGPNEVKIAITGAGNADKHQVRDALVRIHGLRDCPVQADAVDAVAIALTHLMGSRMRAAARNQIPIRTRSVSR